MARFVLLDTGPLNLACSPPGTEPVDRCRAWLVQLEFSATEVIIQAVAEYEVRRELLRLGAAAKLRRRDALRVRFGCLDIRVAALDRAAAFWTLLRGTGHQTAGDAELDADVILAGMAASLKGPRDEVIIATTLDSTVGGESEADRSTDWQGSVPNGTRISRDCPPALPSV